jgi:dihydrofolate reductase
MGKVIVIQFVTADGVVQDPDGSGGTPAGGWGYRFGLEAIAGDAFRLGSSLDDGVVLFGRLTWESFATRWPNRTDEFSTRMNKARKLVASRTLDDVAAWDNSTLLAGSLADAVGAEVRDHDVVVMGSTGIVRELAAADLVDEYRLLVCPIVRGCGEQLFPAGAPPITLDLTMAEQRGPTVLLQYDVVR